MGKNLFTIIFETISPETTRIQSIHITKITKFNNTAKVSIIYNANQQLTRLSRDCWKTFTIFFTM